MAHKRAGRWMQSLSNNMERAISLIDVELGCALYLLSFVATNTILSFLQGSLCSEYAEDNQGACDPFTLFYNGSSVILKYISSPPTSPAPPTHLARPRIGRHRRRPRARSLPSPVKEEALPSNPTVSLPLLFSSSETQLTTWLYRYPLEAFGQTISTHYLLDKSKVT